ncbi:hypothetical protein [Nocardioides abyssi]|uniref:Bacterial Ig-like domain-containing protein n=1 Tax=Nocardioides abyssi TaxID=3058370 RepID=A0ABT8EW73_9ACTN|nr:hypothetical protein [Nocardioides abyssi]MDN4162442.1 hypothetical protein [Nocardioides abyssi]
MNTLDDLRETLQRHGDAVADHERHARPAAVRARVRIARRRRTTTLAAAAAFVLVAGVGTVTAVVAPDRTEGPGPATEVVGVTVADSISVAGFPYALSTTEVLDDGDRVRLPETTATRAVSLVATGLGSGAATLYEAGEAVGRVRGAEAVDVPVPVSTLGTTLRVEVDGAPAGARVGVAVYEGTGALAEGVDNGRAVFRSTIGAASLLAADFADGGETEASVTFRGRLGAVRVARYCTSEEPGLWVHIDVDGDGPISGQCSAEDSVDAGPSWYSLDDPGPVGDHTVRAYLTRGENGPEVRPSGAEVGVAVYRQSAPTVAMAGLDVETVIEHAGRTWRLDPLVPGTGDTFRGEHDWSTVVDTADGDALAVLVGEGGLVRATWQGRLSRGGSASFGSQVGPAVLVGGVLLEGDEYDVRVLARGTGARAALLVYRPL